MSPAGNARKPETRVDDGFNLCLLATRTAHWHANDGFSVGRHDTGHHAGITKPCPPTR